MTMDWRRLLRQLLYFITGRGPARIKLLGLDGPARLKKMSDGSVIFGIRVEPYFDGVALKIDAPGADMLLRDDSGEQYHAYSMAELEVGGEPVTVWVSIEHCTCPAITITASHGWLLKKKVIRVVSHGV